MGVPTGTAVEATNTNHATLPAMFYEKGLCTGSDLARQAGKKEGYMTYSTYTALIYH